MVENTNHNLPSRYKFIKQISSDKNTIEILCKDSTTSKDVSIKIIKDAFQESFETKKILREVSILCNFSLKIAHLKHENIQSLVELIKPKSASEYNDINIVTEHPDGSLNLLIAAKVNKY